MNSLAIITRAYDAEAPYIASFIAHYKKMGVKEFHIVVPKGNRYDLLLNACTVHKDIKFYIDYIFESERGFKGVQNIAVPHVESSHILSVDVDEYLYTDEIGPLLEHDYLLLKWTIVPYQNCDSKLLHSFVDGQTKYIVKTDICKKLKEHDCETTNGAIPSETSTPLLHFVYRSFLDVYLKCALGNYSDYQDTEDTQFKAGIIDCKNLPLKFKMAAIYQRISDSSESCHSPNLCQIDLKVEQALIKQTNHFKKLDLLQKAMLKYKSRIDLPKLVDAMKKSKEFYAYGRIPHSKLATLSDNTLMTELCPSSWLTKRPNSPSRLGEKLWKCLFRS